jgi:hypothetical protein
MKTIKPIKINSINLMNEKLTSAEIGKLWAIYMGNTMTVCILKYYLQHVEDPDIKIILQGSLDLCKEILQGIKEIFVKETIPVPNGFTEDDVNLGAPRLFADEFYLHYLKYAAKTGLSLYSTAIALMIRPDVLDFILFVNKATVKLLNELNEMMLKKGYLTKPPIIPYPSKVEYVTKQSYLNGFFGEVRSLHALEIAHLHDNIENNTTSKALLIGFSQGAKDKEVREFFKRGKDLTMKHIESCTHKLNKEDLPSHPLLGHLVENSTFAPYSDRVMLFHKIDMFSMKIRTYANAISLNGRRDLAGMYAGFIMDIGRYVEDGANIMIEKGWMEKPPQAADRDSLASK